jgi:hypothetical protein
MAVGFDVSAFISQPPGSVTGSISVAIAPTASATLLLAALITANTTGGSAGALTVPTSPITYNGVAMSPIANIAATSLDANIYLYGALSPISGSHTVACSYTIGSGAGTTVDLDCFTFKGTDISSLATCVPSANVITDQSNCTTTVYPASPFNITTVSGDAACALINSQQSGIDNAPAHGTSINADGTNAVNYNSMYALAVGTTTQLQGGVNFLGGNPCCGIAIRIRQPQVGGGGQGLLLPRSVPGLGPRARHTALLNAALPIPPLPVLGSTLPIIGVG